MAKDKKEEIEEIILEDNNEDVNTIEEIKDEKDNENVNEYGNDNALSKEQEYLLSEIKKLRNKKIIIAILSAFLIVDLVLLIIYLIGINKFLPFVK